MRKGCQLKSFPVSLVKALICVVHTRLLDEGHIEGELSEKCLCRSTDGRVVQLRPFLMSAEDHDGSHKFGAHMGGSHGDASQVLPHPGSDQNDGDELDDSAIIRHVSTIPFDATMALIHFRGACLPWCEIAWY